MKVINTDQGNDDPKLFIIFSAVSLLFLIIFYSFLRQYIPDDWQAKKYSLGVFSKMELPAICILGFAVMMLFTNVWQAISAFILSLLFFLFSYSWAFELSILMGPDAYSTAVYAELGCFPDKWLPFLERNHLPLADHVTLCSTYTK